jgi:hypothetical protein
MMRFITEHQTNECNKALLIRVLDEPGAGGANHSYEIITTNSHPPDQIVFQAQIVSLAQLQFQKGPIQEVGTNGITHEAVLAILIDRLRGFQAGPFACRENALAMTRLEEAAHWLDHRTRVREARGVDSRSAPGVEGTSTV